MGNPETERHLIQGLVGDKHLDLWHNSPHFHAGVKVLAQLLPMMVDGMAADAREKQRANHDYAQRMMREAQRPIRAVPDPERPGHLRRVEEDGRGPSGS